MAVALLGKETYLALIENSVGSHLFRTVYATVDGVRTDILRGGNHSCTFFVSSILTHRNFRLIEEVHTRLAGLIADMEACGWVRTNERVPGAIVVWEQTVTHPSGETHDHVGFVIDEQTAISNYDHDICAPAKHHINFENDPNGKPWRAIEAIYTHPFLES